MKQFVGGLAVLIFATSITWYVAVEQLISEPNVTNQATTIEGSTGVGASASSLEPQQVSPKISSRGDVGDIQLLPPIPPKEEVRYYDIPLSKDLQKYIWNLSEKYSVPYELILSVIETESGFDAKASSGISVGLMQINTSDDTFKWLSQECGIINANPRNPYHSVQMGVYYLSYLKSVWVSKGETAHADSAMLLSYNMGLGGAEKYIGSNGFTSSYTTKVYVNQEAILNGKR